MGLFGDLFKVCATIGGAAVFGPLVGAAGIATIIATSETSGSESDDD